MRVAETSKAVGVPMASFLCIEIVFPVVLLESALCHKIVAAFDVITPRRARESSGLRLLDLMTLPTTAQGLSNPHTMSSSIPRNPQPKSPRKTQISLSGTRMTRTTQ